MNHVQFVLVSFFCTFTAFVIATKNDHVHLSLCILMNSSLRFDTINMGKSILLMDFSYSLPGLIQ